MHVKQKIGILQKVSFRFKLSWRGKKNIFPAKFILPYIFRFILAFIYGPSGRTATLKISSYNISKWENSVN